MVTSSGLSPRGSHTDLLSQPIITHIEWLAPPCTETSDDNGRLLSAAPGPLLLPTALIHIPSPAWPAGQVSEERKQWSDMGLWTAKGQQDVTILITTRREVLLLPS